MSDIADNLKDPNKTFSTKDAKQHFGELMNTAQLEHLRSELAIGEAEDVGIFIDSIIFSLSEVSFHLINDLPARSTE
jgi:hypothetical protein